MRTPRTSTVTFHLLRLALCVVGVLLTFVAFRMVMPNFGVVSYSVDGGETRTGSFPLVFSSAGKRIEVETVAVLPWVHPSYYIVQGDDCVEQIFINGQQVKADLSAACYFAAGSRIDLAPYLQPGANAFRFMVHDNGGLGSVDVRPSWTDPVFLLLGLLLVVLLLGGATSVLKIAGAKAGTHWLLLIVMIGALARFGVAWNPGHGSDMGINQGWARSAVKLGVAQSYREQLDGNMIPNYPPLSMLMFAGTGHFYNLLSPGYVRIPLLERIVIKLPAIFTDLLAVILLYFLVRRLKGERMGLLVSTVYALHPAVIYDSAVWGQTDALFTTAMLACLMALMYRRWYLVGALAAAALMFKMQAVVLLPVLGILCIFHWRRSFEIISGGLIMIGLVLLPFSLGGSFWNAIEIYTKQSIGHYSTIAMGAFNLWRAMYGDKAGGTDKTIFFNTVSFRTLGLIMFSIAVASTLFIYWQRLKRSTRKSAQPDDHLAPFLATGLVSYAFFMLNTEMHERYLFPYMLMGIFFLCQGQKATRLYFFASLLFLLNLMLVQSFNEWDRLLWNEFHGLQMFVAVSQVIVFFVTFAFVSEQEKENIALTKQNLLKTLKKMKRTVLGGFRAVKT